MPEPTKLTTTVVPRSAQEIPKPDATEPGVHQDTGVPRYQLAGQPPWRAMWDVVSARVQAITNQAVRNLSKRTLKIGISARIFHPEPGALGLRSKSFQYLEESIAQWVMSRDVMVFMV